VRGYQKCPQFPFLSKTIVIVDEREFRVSKIVVYSEKRRFVIENRHCPIQTEYNTPAVNRFVLYKRPTADYRIPLFVNAAFFENYKIRPCDGYINYK